MSSSRRCHPPFRDHRLGRPGLWSSRAAGEDRPGVGPPPPRPYDPASARSGTGSSRSGVARQRWPSGSSNVHTLPTNALLCRASAVGSERSRRAIPASDAPTQPPHPPLPDRESARWPTPSAGPAQEPVWRPWSKKEPAEGPAHGQDLHRRRRGQPMLNARPSSHRPALRPTPLKRSQRARITAAQPVDLDVPARSAGPPLAGDEGAA